MVAPFFDCPARAVWCEQEVSITVGDTSGFVFAGERQTSVSLLPGQEVRVAWTMVAYTAGLMALPDVQVASARYSARMKMTSSNKASLAVHYVGPSVDAEKKCSADIYMIIVHTPYKYMFSCAHVIEEVAVVSSNGT
jgi:hypothetical protein